MTVTHNEQTNCRGNSLIEGRRCRTFCLCVWVGCLCVPTLNMRPFQDVGEEDAVW